MKPAEVLQIVHDVAQTFGPATVEAVRAVIMHARATHPELADPPPQDSQAEIDERIDTLVDEAEK